MVSNKKYFLIFFLFTFSLLLISPIFSNAQQYKYLVYFKDKNSSPYLLSNPSAFLSQKAIHRRVKQNILLTEQDLPVNPSYLNSLASTGVQVLFSSKWFNVALILADPSQLTSVNSLPCVVSSNKVTRKTKSYSDTLAQVNLRTASIMSLDYGPSFSQVSMIGINDMHDEGYAGEGMTIAILDGGFQNANTFSIFDSLFMKNRIISTYDFVDSEVNVFNDHYHGMQVLSVLAGYKPGGLIGGAWKANYILLRTENDASESVSEEANWLIAAEYADSAGADIINSSLGYNTFDDATMDYSYMDMDGNSTIITKAADIAASKGILVVNSAGNEGNNPWKYILAPADGDSVLAIGAVKSNGAYYSNSSIGPSYDGRIKPDVAAQGNAVVVANLSNGITTGSGTSFAAPLIAGLAAGLWQAFPELTNMEVLNYLRRSGSQYNNPDYKLGYGIPNFRLAKNLILSKDVESISVFPNPVNNQPLTIKLPQSELGKEISVRFTDLMGREISKEVISWGESNNELSTLNYLPSGIYILTFIISGQNHIYKIIKN